MALLVVLIVVVFLAGLSMELKLGRLVRISLAIHDQLKELVELQKAATAKSAYAQAPPPTLPASTAKPEPRPSDVAPAAPKVYRID